MSALPELPDASRECFGNKLDTLIACLPPSPFKEAFIDEIGELRHQSRKAALEESAKVCDLAITQNNETEAKLIGLEKLVSRGAEMQAKKLAETIRSLK